MKNADFILQSYRDYNNYNKTKDVFC